MIDVPALPPTAAQPLPELLDQLAQSLAWDEASARRVSDKAADFITKIRAVSGSRTEVETFLQYYPLDTAEGRALMTLAECLLRIPDPATADRLIAEKLSVSDWALLANAAPMIRAAGSGLKIARAAYKDEARWGKLARPVIRRAVAGVVRQLGSQFVLGETIEDALARAKTLATKDRLRCSFDMLGEGARTDDDAQRYFVAYRTALAEIGKKADHTIPLESRHGMSVKLSALHPRYHWPHAASCIPEITERLVILAREAATQGITLTVDAEECDRLELSLEIIRRTIAALGDHRDWRGFGLAVQAYDRRCLATIEKLAQFAREAGQTIQVRLVKGAYWDLEIKRAQIAGLSDYPVFQRKSQTDLSYLAAARKLLACRDVIYPMFATHNAHTAAAILDFTQGRKDGFEFQRLHGMGAALGQILRQDEDVPVTIYAPVGPYQDLLPYLVRRMLENGANVSFVSKLRRADVTVKDLARDPVACVREEAAPEPLPLPARIYGADRLNACGIDLSGYSVRKEFFARIPAKGDYTLPPQPEVNQAFAKAGAAFPAWNARTAEDRADCLRRTADLIESETPALMALLMDEAKKTFADAHAEIREAVDFCRYYAAHGERDFRPDGLPLTGPTGESNRLRLSGRGVFVCISPWNFPLAIFTGQVAAALMAGNSVIVKPAEETPQIAAFAVSLFHRAEAPTDALIFMNGDGRTGAELVRHPDVAGVAFTGSTEVARHIARALAAKDGPIVPLIAETGGQNAMIVDTTALPEQVVDDVILSAFGSAGQRCSALRVLYLPVETADRILAMLAGAMAKLHVGPARDIATDVGEVIDNEAQQKLRAHLTYLEGCGRKIASASLPADQEGRCYVAPTAVEINTLGQLSGEVFGPVLHVIRYQSADLEKIIAEINATGYGLTFGLQSRIEGRFGELADKIKAGNIYINRSMIGATVGVQPFGGQGLSGTGPKAGGPRYLHRFATEQTISSNLMALGGNIDLIARDLW